MIRLAYSSLRRDARAVVAPFLLLTVAAVLLSIALHFLWSAITPEGSAAIQAAPSGTAGALASLAIVLIVLGLGVPITVTASIVSSLAIRESEGVYASWRLAGASPKQVRKAVRMRSFLVAFIAALVGYALSLPFLQATVSYLVSSTDIPVDLRVTLGVVPFAALVAIMCLLTFLGSLRPAKRASTVKPAVLFSERLIAVRHPIVRWIFSALFALTAVGLGILALGTDQTSDRAMQAIFVGFSLIIFITLGAPWLLPPLTKLWTRVVSESRVPAWYLARRYVLARLGSTTAAVIPLMIAASMIGVYFSAISTWESVVGRELSGGGANTAQGLILFGPGAVLAIVAATCNLFTTGTGRERYEGSLRAAGSPRSLSRAAGLLEAAIYAVTAFILSVLVSAFASLMIGMPVALTGGGFHFVVNIGVIALTVLVGFIPLAVSIRLPATAASRKSLGTVLAPR